MLVHRPVLAEEAVVALAVDPEGAYVDATFGRGGHSRAILAHLGASGRLLALDRDPEAIAAAAAIGDERLTVRHARFSTLRDEAEAAGFAAVQGVYRYQVEKGPGYINDYDIERFYRAAKVLEIYEGTKEIEKTIIGRNILGKT